MKTAIITGASVGIGNATASVFAAQDFHVYNLSRRPCPVPGVTNIACDLLDDTQLRAATNRLLEALGNSEQACLIHNAALMCKDSVDDCPTDQLMRVLSLNVGAINSLNQQLIPRLPVNSSVLYVGSTLAEKAVPGTFSYVVSKHAQLGMMRATCQDLMGRGIHTALICPGFTDTEMLRTHLNNDEETLAVIAQLNSFGRLIDPEEIAELLRWAHHNPVINGAVLHANLGQKES